MEAWIQHTPSGSVMCIFEFGRSTTYAAASVAFTSTTNAVFEFAGDETSPTLSSNIAPSSSWTHIAVTADGTNLKSYTNGVLLGTVANTWTPASIGAQPHFDIGDSGPGGSRFFNGNIAHVAIYPTALSAARILAHYKAAATVL